MHDLDFAIDLARQAGRILRDIHERGPNQITSKSSLVDLVTEADLASDRLIVERLSQHYPVCAVITEEAGGDLPVNGAAWVADPLDGTTNFAHGYPIFAVSLALLEDGATRLGVTYDPLRDEMFWAERGRGAWCNGRPLRVSRTDRLDHSLLATGFQYDRATNADNNLAEFCHFMPLVRGVRRSGSAALELAWLAAGRLDGFWEKGLNPWDTAAGALLVEEAGGQVTTYDNLPWRPTVRNIVADNGVSALHEAILAGLRTARQGLPRLT